MPKASVNEDHSAFSNKGHVRSSRQRGVMETIAVSHRKDELPHQHFRLCVLTANAPHVLAAFGSVKMIHQETSTG
jgi:hypothetical protein